MSIAQSLLPEFEQEMNKTRSLLASIPGDRVAWKPHEKSYSMGELALHLANLPFWTNITLEREMFDVNPPGEEPQPKREFTSVDDLLAEFDKKVADARTIIENTPDEIFFADWTLKNGGEEVFTAPKVGVIRSFVLNHIIHHRAQLGVYLRLNDIPVPMTYGPTADFTSFG